MKAAVKPRVEIEGRLDLGEALLASERGYVSTPFVIFVDPASACNFKCTFCPTGHRDLISDRFNGLMKLDLFRKVVDDLAEFDQPVKVLRLYKDGEPFLNKHLPAMVRYAKASPQVEKVDTTTNGSLLDPGRVAPVLEAGIDRINISIDGMNSDDFSRITKARVNFDKVVADIKWIYANKGNCMIVIKTMNEIIGDRRQQFFDTFGDYCDRIFVENFSPCWPQFDGEERTGWKITQGLYGQPIGDTDSCPYILYGYSVNPEGLVSACFIDWGRRLVIGDVRTESMINIWNSKKMNDLRLMHLEGKRRNHPVCGACGQLSNCLPDNIDMHRDTLLEKLREACD